MKKIIFSIAVIATMSGCTSFLSIGSPEYGCSGMPEGVSCVSARDVYSATESDGFQTQMMLEQASRGGDESSDDQVEGQGTRVLYREPGMNAPIPARAENPLPIRTQAVVMRIAVDPWEDENGDLYIPGYIYTEIEARRWEIGSRPPAARQVLSPLGTRE